MDRPALSQKLILLLAGMIAMTSVAASGFALQAGAGRIDRSIPAAACTILVGDAVVAVARDARPRTFESVQDAVDAAKPGDVVCVASPARDDERIAVTTSGKAGAPIRIHALRAVRVAGFVVEADHIEIDGFSVTNRGHGDDRGRSMGIYLDGSFLRVENNMVSDTDGAGIGCDSSPASCADVVIANNTVRGADGTGILVAGERIRVERNDVSGSVKRDATDADGIRFFGSEIAIRGNYVHDIFDRGYPEGDNPHTDCFQTFDNSKPPTHNVLIEGNVCENVDHQCLIGTTDERQDSNLIVFRNNVCGNNGSQGVYLRGFPDVEVTNNLFLPSIEYFGVVLRSESTNTVIANNVFIGAIGPYDVDDSSRPGLKADHNLIYDPAEVTEPDWYSWSEPNGMWGVDPMLAGGSAAARLNALRPAAGSPLVDAGSAAYNRSPEDIDGNPRVVDGDGDGKAEIDIGPFELQRQPEAAP